MIHIIRDRATKQQMGEMMEMLGTYVKLAVDIERRVLAGGGAMHADCEICPARRWKPAGIHLGRGLESNNTGNDVRGAH